MIELEILQEGSWDKAEEYYQNNDYIETFKCDICGAIFKASYLKHEYEMNQFDGTYAYCYFCKNLCYPCGKEQE